ncbi:methyl-accepting chemotaxis protein [Leptospira levettii]|uniref:methyl-accepting chemotaxis protein n=1 Tax=Leptospira levettii TaxID=2023178 RepID=UPI000C297D0C|nr:methyl-accepting chemotaxis protein [Leptospira levettii]MCW7473061.1 methyl-accepting chemotaxis protein [Leptospira levettii]PJZ36363.1 methyl-accepting chemotaxis protein [Leptospira levettii]PJZ88352.1 methyl-accepting chemotaxis protein [Leptospira levettii]PJZ99309.1 methyl-accepting chemotaxis protein [Leptospira levettii]
MSIKKKIILISLAVISIIIAGIMIVLSMVVRSTLQHNLEEDTKYISSKVTSDISNTLKSPMKKTFAFRKSYDNGNIISRADAINYLKSLNKENDIAFATYCGFEPNAFDGKDSLYKNTKDHDGTGRFIPYIFRDGDKLFSEPLKNVDDPIQGEFYQKPKSTLQTSITSPYIYKVGKTDMFIVSIMEPILRNGKFIGIAGIDISLTTIKSYLDSLKFADGEGKITLISDNHLVLYDGFTHLSEGLDFRSAADPYFYDRIKNNDTNIYEFNDYFHVAVPISIIEKNDPWFARISVPKSQIQSTLNSIIIVTIGLGILGVTLSILSIYFSFQKLVDRRIQSINASTTKVASGDLRHLIQIDQMDELGSIMVTLNQMIEHLRKLIRIAQKSSGKISETTEKIQNTITELTDLAQNQAASSEEASATVEELNASSETIHSNVLSAVENTETIHQSLGDIQNLMKKILEKVNTFGEISVRANQNAEEGRSMAKETSLAIREIQEKSKTITAFSNVISDIAKRTGLLALNAAIEAARAGESGKGFAVVAEEITKLASQSAESVSQINTLSEEALDSIERGNQQVERLVEVLKKITDEVSLIFISSNEIGPLIEDQSSRTESIYTEVVEITEQVKSIQLSTEEQQRATNELANMTINISNGSQVLSDQSSSMAENAERLGQVTNTLDELLKTFRIEKEV